MITEGHTLAISATCSMCGKRVSLGRIYRCDVCEGPLDIDYDYSKIGHASFEGTSGTRADGMWVYRDLLPVSPGYMVTLGEGQTPLLKAERLGRSVGLRSLWVKDETRQPTGSFKDRPISVAVSQAREMGTDIVVTASTGNAAASMAAYAAKAGIRAVVLVPADTPVTKLLQIASPGARIVCVDGSFSDCSELAHAAASEFGWCNVTSTFENPYSVEGDKTVAYEIAAALGWRGPSWIIVPVGSGPLLVGIGKGFAEMQRAGLVDHLPKLVAAQAAGCAPIARAFVQNADTVEPWESPHTVAMGIRDPLVGYSVDGTYTLRAVRRSGGQAVAVADEVLLHSARLLIETEGLYVEPSVGVAVAAVSALADAGTIDADDTVVIVSTGHGLKQSPMSVDEMQGLPKIRPGLESLDALRLVL